jgi:ABC-2 type transport system permease protein
MSKALVLARKEIRINFVTPLAYVVITCFMFLGGVFFFSLLQKYNGGLMQGMFGLGSTPNLNEWVILPYYRSLFYVLVFLLPLLTMRAFAEEKRSGTYEFLITSPISVSEIVWGKFLGIASVAFALLGVSLIFPLLLIAYADPEVPPIFIGFCGLALFTLAGTALGVGISACTRSQTVAGVVTLVSLMMLIILDAQAQAIGARVGRIVEIISTNVLGFNFTGVAGTVTDMISYAAPATHLEPMLRGVFESNALVYFLSLILVGLFVAGRALDASRWR